MTALPQAAASALWVMHHVGSRTEAEQWARTAVERGASQELADANLAAWDGENAPVVWHATPDHLTGSERYGGGDPMADYRHLKGEL